MLQVQEISILMTQEQKISIFRGLEAETYRFSVVRGLKTLIFEVWREFFCGPETENIYFY